MSTDGRKQKKAALILAEFPRTRDVFHAAEQVRDAGYTHWDVHSSFPIHGLDRVMKLGDSRLGWIVLVFALTGLFGAFAMMFWMGTIDYPFVAGGKPPGALAPMAPILFELTILMSSFGVVLGMLHLNRMPRHNHPIFTSDRFRAASDDKFFISVEAEDPKFDVERTSALLKDAHATSVEVIEEDGA